MGCFAFLSLYTLCLVAKHKLSDVLKALSCTILRNVRIEKMYIPYFLEYLPRDLAKIFPSCAGNKKVYGLSLLTVNGIEKSAAVVFYIMLVLLKGGFY